MRVVWSRLSYLLIAIIIRVAFWDHLVVIAFELQNMCRIAAISVSAASVSEANSQMFHF